MADSSGYALHRPEILPSLQNGDRLIAEAMARQASKVVQPGEPVLSEGEAHDYVYRLRTGWAARTRVLPDARKQIQIVFLPGDFFGTKCLYLARQPDAIEALGIATVDLIHYEELRQLLAANPDAALRIAFQAMEDERRLHNIVVALGRGKARERLAAMLLDFRGRLHRARLGEENSYRLPMTQQQIGNYLGLTPVHVNRVLKQFRDEGLAVIERQTARLRDVPGLARLADPVRDVFERSTPAFGGSEPEE